LIGVVSKAGQAGAVREFFELFKTPWEFYAPGRSYDVLIATAEEVPDVAVKLLVVSGASAKDTTRQGAVRHDAVPQGTVVHDRDRSLPVYGELLTFAREIEAVACLTAGSEIAALKVRSSDSLVVHLGYDLFEEVRFLLSAGQPAEHASTPALDLHIQLLREWMLEAELAFFEILPAPAGYSFVACLTHDIDFVGIRRHFLDHSAWGFLLRATVGSVRNFVQGRLSFERLLKSWRAAASLPFVYAGWANDFWEPFPWYLEAEQGLPATYFLIPFKRRAGDKVPGRHASRRATAYDVTDLAEWTAVLQERGCELGVHGIDAWHSEDRGREELARLETVTGEYATGIRMHWLLQDENTPSVLERAGYVYDSTCGYNETVGYRAGTSQVFRPLEAQTLLELPMHIQDGALFYPQRLGLTEAEALKRCEALIANAQRFGGVLTLLWHDRSHGPERFWGEFYRTLLHKLKSLDGWFGSAAQVTSWFRQRREVCFERGRDAQVSIVYAGAEIQPPLNVRVYGAESGQGTRGCVDLPWSGKPAEELEIRTNRALLPALSRS